MHYVKCMILLPVFRKVQAASTYLPILNLGEHHTIVKFTFIKEGKNIYGKILLSTKSKI